MRAARSCGTGDQVFEQMLALISVGICRRGGGKSDVERSHGAIVNVAAKAAVDQLLAQLLNAAYKSAAVALLDALAARLKRERRSRELHSPHIIDTEANRKAMPKADFGSAETRGHRAGHPVFVQRPTPGHSWRAIPVYGDS